MRFSDDVLRLNPGLSPLTPARVKADRAVVFADGFESQLERDFNDELTARQYWIVQPHGWTFHLPGGVDYTPDFIAWVRHLATVRVYEVKGDLKQKNARDSRTRFKIAAGLYPCFVFIWVTRDSRGQWRETELTPTAKGRSHD